MAKLGTTAFRPGVPTRPDYIDSRVLAATTAEQHTVPTGMAYCYLSAEMPVFLAWGSNPTAAIPGSDVTDGTSSFLMVHDMWLPCSDIAKISIVSRVAGVVTLAFYAP